MELDALATPVDHRKLEYLRNTFTGVLKAVDTLEFPPKARKEARKILKAASRATIFDGEYSAVVRKYYAFTSDHKNVWFTLDLFNVMPDLKTKRDLKELELLVRYIAAGLVGEVRDGLREEMII
jgi:hypothetical protein